MRYLAIICCIALLIVPVLAQDEELVTVDLSGAFDVTIPESWEVDFQSGTGYFWESEDSTLRVRGYSPFFFVDWSVDNTIEALMEFLVVDVFNTREYDESQVEETTFGEWDGIMYTYEQLDQGRSFERTIMIADGGEGYAFVGYIVPLEGETLNPDDVADLEAAVSSITRRDEYIFYDNTTIPIPDGWAVVDDDNYGIADVALSNGDITVDITFWPRYGDIVGFEQNRDFLGYIYNNSFGDNARYDRSTAEDVRVAGFDGIYFAYNAETLNEFDMYPIGVMTFATQPNNTYLTVDIMATEADIDLDPVYDLLDEVRPGNRNVCPIFTDPGDRIRSRPTVNSELVGETGDSVYIAVAQTIGEDGFVWFDIRDGWMRSDIVFYEVNTCENLPER